MICCFPQLLPSTQIQTNMSLLGVLSIVGSCLWRIWAFILLKIYVIVVHFSICLNITYLLAFVINTKLQKFDETELTISQIVDYQHDLLNKEYKIIIQNKCIFTSTPNLNTDNIIIKKRLRMNNQPNWLNIEDELYPEVFINKVIHVEGSPIGAPIDYPTQVIYNSLHREINITQSLSQLIAQYFSATGEYQVFIYDYESQKFTNIGNYPFKQPIILKGIFVQNQFIVIRIQSVNLLTNNLKTKPKTDKTLKIILQKVAQWRKIHIQSGKKITLEEAANKIGISRNTLDDYYFQIKLAEKYGFNFQQQLEEPFQNLRKFVKQNQQKKEKTKSNNPLPYILSKYQSK